MNVEAQWIYTSDQVDISKLSGETRAKLIRFADVAPTYHLSKRVVWMTFADGSAGFSEFRPDKVVRDYFDAREDLKSITEQQVKFFVDNADSTAKTDEFQQHCANQDREPQDYEFTRIWDHTQNFERELIALGERIISTPRK